MSRVLIVEFAGLPGAGKTTIARALAHELRRRGVRCPEETRLGTLVQQANAPGPPNSAARRWISRGAAVLISRRLFAICLKIAFLLRPVSGTRIKWMAQLPSLARAYDILARNSCDQDIIVLDEGMVHYMHGVVFGIDARRCHLAIEKLFRLLYRDRCAGILYLDVDAQNCIERFSRRDGSSSRFNSKTSPELRDGFLASNKYPMILQAAKKVQVRGLGIVDGRGSLEETVSEAVRIVSEWRGNESFAAGSLVSGVTHSYSSDEPMPR